MAKNMSEVGQPVAPIAVDVPLVFGLNAVMLAILGWFGQWSVDQIVRSWERNFTRLEKEIEDLNQSNAGFSDVYVRRDDFVRAMVGVDNKLDSIAKRQNEQFDRILDRLEKE
jgi:hypothetical protein